MIVVICFRSRRRSSPPRESPTYKAVAVTRQRFFAVVRMLGTRSRTAYLPARRGGLIRIISYRIRVRRPVRVQGSCSIEIAVFDAVARLIVILSTAAVPCGKITAKRISRARRARNLRHCRVESRGHRIRAALSALLIERSGNRHRNARGRYNDIAFYVSSVDRNLTVRSIIRIAVRNLRAAYRYRHRGRELISAIGTQSNRGVCAELRRRSTRIRKPGAIHRDGGFCVII